MKKEIQISEKAYLIAETQAKIEGVSIDEYISKKIEQSAPPKKSIMDFVGIFHYDKEINAAETNNDIYDTDD